MGETEITRVCHRHPFGAETVAHRTLVFDRDLPPSRPVGTPTPAREHPIIFMGEMVRATLDDRKTQTRRLRGLATINEDPDVWAFDGFRYEDGLAKFHNILHGPDLILPLPWDVGDRLWVRETFRLSLQGRGNDEFQRMIAYRADGDTLQSSIEHPVRDGLESAFDAIELGVRGYLWRPSIHMPRWASRIDLEALDLRYERIQDISFEDCLAEGINVDAAMALPCEPVAAARAEFCSLWDSIHEAPRPVKKGGVVIHYVSHPWENIQETREYRGKPWYVHGNPWVSVTEYKVVKPCTHSQRRASSME